MSTSFHGFSGPCLNYQELSESSYYERPHAYNRMTSSSIYPPAQCSAEKIRTNPWINHPCQQGLYHSGSKRSILNGTVKREMSNINGQVNGSGGSSTCQKPNLEMLYASVDRSASLRVKSLDESTTSSGYGSQDSSSPESSVHSPNWQKNGENGISSHSKMTHSGSEFTLYAANRLKQIASKKEGYGLVNSPLSMKDDTFSSGISGVFSEEPVYHELEVIKRLSMLEVDEDSEDNGFCCSDTELLMIDTSSSSSFDCSSPIYAVPYEGEMSRSSRKQSSYQDDEPIYADVISLELRNNCPTPQPIIDEAKHMETALAMAKASKAEFDFLEELDKQIADLQIQSEAMKKLVEQAKERDEARQKNRQMCLKEISQLRNMRWIVRNNFELCL
uniref:SCHIP-1 domain-containing protein n=1 Tax=Rhabditophanes sp. KR3021 TaxID=114890 RepID=A0AC35UHL1_9BILA